MITHRPYSNTTCPLFHYWKGILKGKTCDSNNSRLYVNNISNNNDIISHRYYPVIKMGDNRIWVGVGWRVGDHTWGKLVLYMINLIKTLNVIMKKEWHRLDRNVNINLDCSYSPSWQGRTFHFTISLLSEIFRRIYTQVGWEKLSELMVQICTPGRESLIIPVSQLSNFQSVMQQCGDSEGTQTHSRLCFLVFSYLYNLYNCLNLCFCTLFPRNKPVCFFSVTCTDGKVCCE